MPRVNKKIVIALSAALIVVIAVAAGLLLHHSDASKKLSSAKETVGNHTISLNQESEPTSSGGLSVSGEAGSLGQLNNSEGNNKSQNSGGNSSASGDVNPSTFSQYNKYSSSKDALFGDIQQGNGAQLAVGQKANIYYKVWLTNGALVDQSPTSSSGQPQPFSFTLGAHQVIPGLEEGALGMKVGGKRLVIVPPAVGYGAQGQGSIPPNAVLVFEVQLVNAQ